MAVNVQIKTNCPLTVPEIAGMTGLKYGISDESYKLQDGKLGEYSLLYDPQKLARGIEISYDDGSINLKLSLPTTGSEVRGFYNLIGDICQRLGVSEYYRDEELVSVSDAELFTKADITASVDALMDICDKLESGETDRFAILGVMNPIFLSAIQINYDYEHFENVLNNLQQMDVYYAAPRAYRKQDDSIFACYAISEGVLSVVPKEPYILMAQVKISDWYVLLPEQIVVRYDDFISNVKIQDNYDSHHVIINLTSNEIETLKQFQTEI